MRPIVWGIILLVVGGFFWVTFSVIYGVGIGFGAPENPTLPALVYIFGFVFFFSIPLTIVAEVVRWGRRRRASARPSRQKPSLCINCGSQHPAGQTYCSECGTRIGER